MRLIGESCSRCRLKYIKICCNFAKLWAKTTWALFSVTQYIHIRLFCQKYAIAYNNNAGPWNEHSSVNTDILGSWNAFPIFEGLHNGVPAHSGLILQL